jgi:adenine phosphoribosyltransferase
MEAEIAKLNEKLRTVPDYPKPGISFKDITPILNCPEHYGLLIDLMAKQIKEAGHAVDKIVGIESRGFILGAALASKLGVGFTPVRKRGKLPWKTISQTYALEYGEDHVEIHEDAILEGEKVIIVDDLIATGGTAAATIELCQKLGAELCGLHIFIELSFLNGRELLKGVPCHSLLKLN